MQGWAQTGMLVTCILAVYVGLRTLYRWTQTRRVQELAIGANVLSLAVGAMILNALGVLGSSAGKDVPFLPHLLGLSGLALHVVAIYLGTWKIFRPAAKWPRPLMGLVVAAMGGWLFVVLSGLEPGAAGSLIWLVPRALGMTWAGWECFRYAAMLRKRVAIGLAEPMMAHRFALWGIGAVASTASSGLDIGSWLLRGAPLGATPLGLNVMSLFGVIGIVTVALAFFPPAFYLRWIEAARRETA